MKILPQRISQKRNPIPLKMKFCTWREAVRKKVENTLSVGESASPLHAFYLFDIISVLSSPFQVHNNTFNHRKIKITTLGVFLNSYMPF